MFKLFLGVIVSGFFVACEEPGESITEPEETAKESRQEASPKKVKVQHILIAFEGSLPGKNVKRSQQEAKKLAEDLLQKANEGEQSFQELVKAYSDDQDPGIYELSNLGLQPNEGEFARSDMVQGFGDLAFSLETDEIGLVEYSEERSPFGYHILKRLE